MRSETAGSVYVSLDFVDATLRRLWIMFYFKNSAFLFAFLPIRQYTWLGSNCKLCVLGTELTAFLTSVLCACGSGLSPTLGQSLCQKLGLSSFWTPLHFPAAAIAPNSALWFCRPEDDEVSVGVLATPQNADFSLKPHRSLALT